MTALFSALLLARFASAEPIPVPPLADVETGHFETRLSDGTLLWTAMFKVEKTTVDGRPALHLIEQGEGRHNSKTPVKWSIDGLYWIDKVFTADHFDNTVTTPDGKLVEKTRKVFDPKAGKAVFEREDAEGRKTSKTMDAPADTVATEGLATVLRGVPPGKAFEAHLMTGEPHVYKIELSPQGDDHVTTPGGAFDCAKLRLVPQIGPGGIFGGLAPKTMFWFRKADPHLWAQYEGLESGLMSPHVVMKVVSYETTGPTQ
jgi:hypothetical protein